MKSLFELHHHASEGQLAAGADLGHVCEVIAASSTHQHYPLQYLRTVIKPALMHRQVKLYFNSRGEPVAYVVWAYLAPDVEERFQRSGRWDLHISEWNEGGCLWIVDLAARHGHIRPVLRELRDNLFARETCVRYFRIKNRHLLCKELDRNARHFFFRQLA